MAEYKQNFRCVVMSPRKLIFERNVESLFLTGDSGEYELLAYHYPLLGVLKKSDIVIDWKERIPVEGGVIKFFANECIIMVEEQKQKEPQDSEA